MSAPTCYSSIQLCAIRVAELNSAGSPISGANRGYVSDAPIKLDIGVELEEGDEFIQKNGCGAICVNYKDQDKIKNVTLGLELCSLDSQLISLLVGGDTFSSGGNVIGMQLPAVSGSNDNGVCLEAWSKAWDGTAQAVPSFTSPNAAYYHWVFPKVKWSLGNITLENGVAVVPVNGVGSENSRVTTNGPFDDWPSPIANAGGITRVAGWWLDDDLPTASCGFISVTSAAS